jgi:L,D-transpeptidase ErfK/SrfK
MLQRRPRSRRRLILLAAGGIAILVVAVLGVGQLLARGPTSSVPGEVAADPKLLEERVTALREENQRLEATLQKLIPKETHILINSTLNRIYLRNGEEVLMEGVCSTGSNTELVAPDSARRWFFKTPRGVFKVRSRMERPVWVRPDWSFVEEGEPIPGPTAPERYEPGVLGDYGLYLGSGYLIHGTLFQRFLGQPVTHGCIRVGDEDLKEIWDRTRVGTPVYIF